MEPTPSPAALDRYKQHYGKRWLLALPLVAIMAGFFLFALVNQLVGEPGRSIFLALWGLAVLATVVHSLRWYLHHRCPACKVHPYPLGPRHCPNCGVALPH